MLAVGRRLLTHQLGHEHGEPNCFGHANFRLDGQDQASAQVGMFPGIVESADGAVRVDEHASGGALFVVTLPTESA